MSKAFINLILLFLSSILTFNIYGQQLDAILADYTVVNQFIEYKEFEKFSINSWALDMDSSDYLGNHKPFGCTSPIKTTISFKNLCNQINGSECDLSKQINPYLRIWEKSDLDYNIQKSAIFVKWWNYFIQDFLNLFRSKNAINIGQAVKINETDYLIQYYICNRFNVIIQYPKLAHIKTNGIRIISLKEY
jgi:hypothetical protein